MPYLLNPNLDAVMAGMPFGFFRTDLHANVIHSNGYLEKKYGVSYEQIEGNAWQKLVHPEDKKDLLIFFAKEFFFNKITYATTRLVLPQDKILPVMFVMDSLHDEKGKRIGILVNIIDASLALHEFCSKMGIYEQDPLTHVLTRLDFLKKLETDLCLKKKQSIHSALMLIDIKGLQKFNDLWGYSVGDQLLVHLAESLGQAVQGQFEIGRIESAKFSVLIDSVDTRQELEAFAERIYAECNRNFTLSQGTFQIEVSIGVSIIKSDNGDIDFILRQSLEALKLAKKNTPRIEYLDEKDHRIYRRSARIVSYLFDAISQDQFELHYQPQINILSKQLVGFEALLRWNQPELGIIEPDEFIPIAEESGFIIHVGKWVMDHALKQYKCWRDQFGSRLQGIKLSINLSPLQLTDQDLITGLNELLKKYGLQPNDLMIELTENAVMSDLQNNIEVMDRLHEQGVSFSMDDFGTGYSSLNYIRFLPIDQIKIDRSFVRAFEHSRQDAAVVKATLSLAQALGIEVVAEGVETEEEIKLLRDSGCKIVQGFYYSHPLNAKGMEEYIEANT